ncbi:hypothetical protein U2S91_14475 [Stenotrophomonas maltophilia]|nr:hypothetical protein [Stenotrophomonas maltophilia]WQI19349.1 hypothetical protein U2S91_14475 [Stenotrophomonas maltophilia]
MQLIQDVSILLRVAAAMLLGVEREMSNRHRRGHRQVRGCHPGERAVRAGAGGDAAAG